MIAANVDELNQFLSHDLREPIRFGIGIHGGEVIIGDIGYRDHMVFTALGDAVNVAARLQDMTKTLACEAIVSEEVRITAGACGRCAAAAGSRDPRTQRADDRPRRQRARRRCPRWLTMCELPRPERPVSIQRTPERSFRKFSSNSNAVFSNPASKGARLMGDG